MITVWAYTSVSTLWERSPFSPGLGSSLVVSHRTPLAPERTAVSILPSHLQMPPAPAALSRPFGMTLPYGRRQDKDLLLRLTEFINWTGRKCFCGASNSHFKILVPSTQTHASNYQVGEQTFWEFCKCQEHWQFSERCFKGKIFQYFKTNQILVYTL